MLCVDLYCGRGGWALGFLRHGFRVVGIDNVPQPDYPGEFVLADVRQVHGGPYRGARVVVASPPCGEYSKLDMPWYKPSRVVDTELVEHAYRFAFEARAPLILENVRGAQKILGRALAHYDSFYLWGDGVPALMVRGRRKAHKTGPAWNPPWLRAIIPFELADWIARVYA